MVVSGAWREADLANGSHPPATALDAARTRSLFRLIHLPKTGGTSVETLLSLGHQPHRRLSKLAWWCGALDASPSIRAAGCSSGVGRSSSPFLLPHGAGRPATPLLVVLLRHPTERVLSQYYFFRGWHTHVGLLCDRHPPRDTLCAAPEARVRCGQPQTEKSSVDALRKRIDGRRRSSLSETSRARRRRASAARRGCVARRPPRRGATNSRAGRRRGGRRRPPRPRRLRGTEASGRRFFFPPGSPRCPPWLAVALLPETAEWHARTLIGLLGASLRPACELTLAGER